MKEQVNSRFLAFLRSLLFFLLVLAASAASLLLPAILFTPVKKTPEVEASDRRFTVMLNHTPTITNDPYDLAYWLLYSDPSSLALPDWNSGFSSFLRIGNRFSAEHSVFSDDLSLTRSLSSPENQFSAKCRTPDRLLPRLRPPIPRSMPDIKKKKTVRVSRPRWLDLAGTDLGDLFKENPNVRSVLLRETPTGHTLLRIEYRGGNMPPSVRVAVSCGSRALDVLAAGAFAAREARGMSAPPSAGTRYVVIDWNTPRKGKK